MKEYVRPEMEIDSFDENCEVLTESTGDPCGLPNCPINIAYGEGSDPWGGDPWD